MVRLLTAKVIKRPIEEEGGLNLYQFVENRSINAIDYLGLYEYDDKTQTLLVGKCEITIAMGHGSAKKPIKWKFAHPTCSAGAAVMCYPSQNSSNISEGNSVSGAPSHSDQGTWYDPNKSSGAGADIARGSKALKEAINDQGLPSDERNLNIALLNTFSGAYEKARSMCNLGCCLKVSINTKRFNAGGLDRWRDNSPEVDFNYLVDCGRDDKSTFDEAVKDFLRRWQKTE